MGTAIDTLVLHYTGMRTARAALERLCDPMAEVSAHYLITRGGTVWCLVPEAARAWHAGVSGWRGATALNGCSIGIELVNPGHEFGYVGFAAAQMRATIGLCAGILGRWPIDPRRIVGHSDIAPDRKQDPGEKFPWPRLAAAGIGLFPAGRTPPRAAPEALLRAIGYPTERPGCVGAFQRRFRPARVDGVVDEETHERLQAVADAFG